jgi:Reverse transcriptase (RNA-dependent DNA polymerase)
VLADTGAGGSIFFQRELVHNLRNIERPYGIMGIGESVIVVNMEGDSEFGVVGYHSKAGMNILSIGELLDTCERIEISKEQGALVLQMKENGPVYIFRRVNNQFICDLRKDVIRDDVYNVESSVFVGVATVEERMSIFTWAEVERAEEAKELQRTMGFSSPGQLIKQLQIGKIETMITPTDVINAVYIWGKSLGECKGKTTASKPEPEIPVPIPFTGVRVFQTAHMDLMFESGLGFLIIVFKPLDYTYVGLLKSKKAKDIWVTMRQGIREVINRGFMITIAYFDGEKAIGSEDLQHLVWNTFYFELDIKGQGKAVPVVEAKIRRVKEKMRAIVNTLPYVIDLKLLSCLTKYCALRLNGEISAKCTDGLTPRERLYGRRNDKNWIRHGFGDYVQVHDEYTSNKMKGRTQGALALYPTGNLSGTWKYLNLSTWKEVRRNGATPLPMPNEVIAFVNSVASKKKARLEFLKELVEDGDLLPEDIVAAELPEVINPVVDVIGDEGGGGEVDNDLPIQQEQLATAPDDSVVVGDESVDADGVEDSIDEEEMVDSDIVDEIVRDYREYNRGEGVESDLERSRRLTQELLMRDMLAVPVKVFVGLGLQMELSEARSKYGVRAVRAAAEEIKQVLKKGVFTGVTMEESFTYSQKPIPCSMKVKEKMQGGLLEKLKGRLAAGGHRQNKAAFNDVKYAPTVSNTAVMCGAAVAAAMGHAVASIDFTGAFLYAVLPDDKQNAVLMRLGQFLTRILVKLDPSYARFVQPDGTCVVVLKRALYGTIQAAAAWYNTLIADLKKLKYTVSQYDNCVVHRQSNGKQLTLFIHVDDVLFDSGGGETDIDVAVKEIKDMGYEITVHRGRKIRYLGADFDFTVPDEVSISMTDYVDNAVKLFEEKHGEVAVQRVPASDDIFKVSSEGKLCAEKATDYASHV